MYYTKEELVTIFEAAKVAIPSMEIDAEYWAGVRCQWFCDEEDRFEEADEIKEALASGPLRNYKIYTTIGLVEIYVD